MPRSDGVLGYAKHGHRGVNLGESVGPKKLGSDRSFREEMGLGDRRMFRDSRVIEPVETSTRREGARNKELGGRIVVILDSQEPCSAIEQITFQPVVHFSNGSLGLHHRHRDPAVPIRARYRYNPLGSRWFAKHWEIR